MSGPKFPGSGSRLRLCAALAVDGQTLQCVGRSDGTPPQQVCCRFEADLGDADQLKGYDEWVVGDAEAGAVRLSQRWHQHLHLATGGRGVGLTDVLGPNGAWRPLYISEGMWVLINVATGTRLQHLPSMAFSSVSHSAAKEAHPSHLWRLDIQKENQGGLNRWRDEAAAAAAPGGVRPPTLTADWQRCYMLKWGQARRRAPFTLKIVSQRAGVGKTSLFNHLAQQQVTEVLPGNQGNVSEVECSVVCEGLAWTLCDIPGVNGEHQIKDPKRLWLRETWGSLTVKQFIKHYKLDSAAHTDAILYVTSLETTGQRGRSDKQQERKLLRRLYKSSDCVPIIIVNLSASSKVTESCRFETMTHLGLVYDQSRHVHMFNANVPWAHGQSTEQTTTQRARLDFPALLKALSHQTPDNMWCLYSQIQIGHLVHTQVSMALASLKRPGVFSYFWLLSTHTVLGIFAPFYGPVLETVARLTAVALRMLEAVGLMDRPSASTFWQRAKHSLDNMRQKKALLQQKEAELQPARAACMEERRLDHMAARSRAGAVEDVARSAADTVLVAAVEVEIQAALYPAMEVASATVSQDVYAGLISQIAGLAVEAGLEASVPFAGALVSAACMPHAYSCLARYISRIACQRHQAWLLANWQELSKHGPQVISSTMSTGCSSLPSPDGPSTSTAASPATPETSSMVQSRSRVRDSAQSLQQACRRRLWSPASAKRGKAAESSQDREE